MEQKPLIFLIGMMGAGKTTVGRILARKTGWRFADMDRMIEEEEGRAISEIFASEGEAAFRAKETALLKRLCREERCIVSTGGGVILSEENRRLLSESGLVIYLRVTADDVLKRTAGDTTRPNLVSDDKRRRIESLLEIRSQLYFATADISFQSGETSPSGLASKILRHRKVSVLAG